MDPCWPDIKQQGWKIYKKGALEHIYGYEKSYEELLIEADLKTLEERREIALLKFARKAAKNPQFVDWFPRNDNRQSKRHAKPYKEMQARSERLYRSPLYAMRRALNSEGD